MRAARRWFPVAAAGAVTGLLFMGLFLGDSLRSLELNTIDARFDVRGTQHVSDVVVVQIDARTLRALGVDSFPFSRVHHARLIDALRRAGVRAIGYDVAFTGLTRRSADIRLAEALARSGRVALATDAVGAGGQTNLLGGNRLLRAVHARPAHAGAPADPGGFVRRMQYAINGLPTLAVVTAEIAQHKRIPRDDLGGRTTWIDFAGPPGTLATVSFGDVVVGRVGAAALRGKVAVVGPSTQLEEHPTATSGSRQMSGAEIQANAAETALLGFSLRSPGRGFALLLIGLMGGAGTLAGARLRLAFIPLALALVGGGYLAAGQAAFSAGTVLPVVYPLGALAGCGIVVAGVRTGRLAVQRIRGRFEQFSHPDVVEQALGRDGADREIEATVMFSDLRGFTTFSETLPPAKVSETLNRYLSEMSDAILDHGGTIIDYMGDGIMAAFGAPRPLEGHADRAIEAATAMVDTHLARFNAWLTEAFDCPPMQMGVGINTGSVVSATIGSQRRLTYTTLGDTTNTAARLEGMTKGTPHSVFIAHSTWERAGVSSRESLVRVGELAVRGRSEAVEIWTLPSDSISGEPRSSDLTGA